MVSFTDLKVYRSTSDLGGAITGTQIQSGLSNNLFTNVPRSEYVAGTTYYKCVYFKNTHSTESMDDFRIWISGGTPSPNTKINFGFDNTLNSIYLDGTDDGINLGDQTSLWSQAKTKFSFSIMVNAVAWASGGSNRDLIRHDSTSNGRFALESIDAGNNLDFNIKDTGGSTIHAGVASVSTVTWVRVTCTYDNSIGSQNMKIYINKTMSGSAGLTDTVTLTGDLVIGKISGSSVNSYVKDFRWWVNKTLTQAEIDAIVDDTVSAPTPDYWLKMNEGTGSPKDFISQSLTGTLTGAVWNNSAQTIANVNTSPGGIIWYGAGEVPDSLGKIAAGQSFPIWLKLMVDATAAATPAVDDSGIFTIEFDIPQGGTGTGGTGGTGGGTGGNPPPTNTNYKIAVAGDWGCETETDDVISLIQAQGYGLLVGVGDNAYESASCWTTRFTPLKSIFKVSAYGNHEYEESGGTGPYKTFFGRTDTFYTYKFENILFLVIDSNDDKSGVDLDAQATWITNQLEAAKNDSTITWRIVCMHHPWFGASSNHSYNEFNQVQKLHSILVNYKVSFVYTGHNHNWQRTHQVAYNSTTPSSPIVADSSSPYTRSTAGLIHIVTGAGGHDSGSSLYSLGSQPSYQAYQNRTHNGVHELVASNNGQTLTGQFRDINGDVYDTFTITA